MVNWQPKTEPFGTPLKVLDIIPYCKFPWLEQHIRLNAGGHCLNGWVLRDQSRPKGLAWLSCSCSESSWMIWVLCWGKSYGIWNSNPNFGEVSGFFLRFMQHYRRKILARNQFWVGVDVKCIRWFCGGISSSFMRGEVWIQIRTERRNWVVN